MYILVDHYDEAMPRANLKSIRNRKAGTSIFLLKISEP